MAALITAKWGPFQHNLSTEVPRSYHRQGPFLRTACRSSNFQSLHQMLSTRLTYLQKVGLGGRPTPQGLSGLSSQCFQRCENRALRIIIGQLKTTPLEALRMGAGIPNIATQAQQQAAVAFEKAHRLPPNHPRRTMLEEPCRHQLKRPNWRSTTKILTNRFPDAISSRDILKTLLEYSWATKRQSRR